MEKEVYVGYKYKGCIYDFHEPKPNDIELIARNSIYGQEIIRHTFAHIMAQALQRIYGSIYFGVGPVTDQGFYYDFICEHQITSKEFDHIAQEMKSIIRNNYEIKKTFHTKEEAIEILGNNYLKAEIIKDIKESSVSIYSQEEYGDLCRGPHVKYTGDVGYNFKLTNISQINWRGHLMQRLEGVGFATEELLKEYEEAELKKQDNDHRSLGKNMGLFEFLPQSPGMAFWHTKGLWLYRCIESYLRSIMVNYKEVLTPPMYKLDLWKQTGHLDKYRENMYVINDEFTLKPMSCPAHVSLFKLAPTSYKDLPVRMCEFGRVFRNEDRGGVLGLKRARYFCQDDAHIFCASEHIESEVRSVLNLADQVYKHFNLEYLLKISTRPKERIGEEETWDQAEKSLIDAVEGREYVILPGEGAFYGPKIELHIVDQNKKLWQCGTIQVDFFITKRLEATYTDKECKKHHPVVIHHALLGSIERFIGILLEIGIPFKYNPNQVIIIPISKKYLNYASLVKEKLNNYRVELISHNKPLGEKLHLAYKQNPGLVLIVGEQEELNQQVQIQGLGQRSITELLLHLEKLYG